MNLVHKVNVVHAPQEIEVGPEARRAARRRAILTEAHAVVAEGGLDALKLKPLAKRLGYAVGALYRYFDSKESLLAALEVDVLEAFGASLAEAGARARVEAEHPALAALLGQTRAYAAFPEQRPEDFALIGFAVGDPRVLVPGDGAALVFEAARPIFAQVAADLAAAAEAGDLTDGPALDRALVLWSALQGVLQTRKLARVAPELIDSARLADELVQSLLRGWGATPAALEATRRHLDGLAVEGE